MDNSIHYDVVILGAGASGLMCGMTAGQRGRRVLILDHGSRPGRKILASGGGRCNFSNYSVASNNYISQNPHFCKSAIQRFNVYDFLALLENQEIGYEERDHGRLFCTGSAAQIVNMLLDGCRDAGIELKLHSAVKAERSEKGFSVQTDSQAYRCQSLVIATGGMAYPQLGATDVGYRIAEQMGLAIVPLRPGLTPLLYMGGDQHRFQTLSGIALEVNISFGAHHFRDALLFTHGGISGPAVLQISNYWKPGEAIHIDLLPGMDLKEKLLSWKASRPKMFVKTLIAQVLPKRVVQAFLPQPDLDIKPIGEWSDRQLKGLADMIHQWEFNPVCAEGYDKAEVTVGGVDVHGISSKTFEAHSVKGLYFIGEVLDVSGWLGGYNLHWAWASGWCAGQVV